MKIRILLSLLIGVVTCVTFPVYGNTTCTPDLYARCTCVTEIFGSEDPETELIVVVDCNGHEYAFYSDKGDWNVGDYAACVMCGNGTECVEDDIILSATYDRPDLLAAQGK